MVGEVVVDMLETDGILRPLTTLFAGPGGRPIGPPALKEALGCFVLGLCCWGCSWGCSWDKPDGWVYLGAAGMIVGALEMAVLPGGAGTLLVVIVLTGALIWALGAIIAMGCSWPIFGWICGGGGFP